MRRTIVPALLAAALAAAVLPGTAAATGQRSDSRLLVLDSNNTLVEGYSLLPRRTAVKGLAKGEDLIGIDVRPATGALYAMSDRGQLYTVDTRSGKATAIGAKIALDGRAIGFDFNPTVDRIRLVTERGQNLRLHPDTGAVAGTDGVLAYAAGDPAAGKTPKVGGSGYTNSVAGATSTVLYNIDSDRDTLVTQGRAPDVSPNSGQLFTVGRLGIDVTAVHGFDIHPDGTAIAAVSTRVLGLPVGKLVRVDLSTGRARVVAPLLLTSPVGAAFTG
ncbi:DUF4394 domain-containing protein [Actinokineospora guangxiensis]|uniref:DUF4394 domain-containing protein n=1 Tax=Actinokineospora guangxiensis TaxID=1490288 RepID=A0ABW0EY70_9PSEU